VWRECSKAARTLRFLGHHKILSKIRIFLNPVWKSSRSPSLCHLRNTAQIYLEGITGIGKFLTRGKKRPFFAVFHKIFF
jgi:hypothetical protein